MKTKLLIVHLVDSRKSEDEIQAYLDNLTIHSDIGHAFIFGGNPDYQFGKPDWIEASYIYRKSYKCSEAWMEGLKYFFQDAEFGDPMFINVRDMDDEYDDLQMLKELPLEDNVGVIRFNHLTKMNGEVKESTYGLFQGDYFLPTWDKVLPRHQENPVKDLFDAIQKEPHMIHRQFGLVNELVIRDMISYNYIPMNKGEDSSFWMRAYVCSMLRGLGIKVAGSVNIGTYDRDAGQMSGSLEMQTERMWIDRFMEFQNNINSDFNVFLSQIEDPTVHKFVNTVRLERTKGNAKSLMHHLEVLKK